ncbi:MAG TPA: nitroreductase family protein [Candidatus Limnocylindrales bacterium]|nr:nitroreductase family protein [Candidatus Limnocylindrales bacterium]
MGNDQTRQVLYEAAESALAAPSIFNTQPWSWRVHEDRLELHADRSRQLATADSSGRLLTISCGVALHHAMVAVRGFLLQVQLLPDTADADLLAVLWPSGPALPDPRRDGLRLAIAARHTDRRPFQKTPVDGTILDRLTTACAAQGAHLYLVGWHQMSTLALAAVAAGALELSSPGYRMELADWTHRPLWSGDGVPVETAVAQTPRRVPVRDFAPFGGPVTPAGLDNDFGATYGIIHTNADTRHDWLTAGMGLSAVLLTATAARLGSATISDVTEPDMIRDHIRGLLPSGYPQVAVRIGHPQPGQPAAAPRRPAAEVISGAWA